MIATTLLLLIVLLALSVPVAAVMGVLGLALNQFYAVMPLHRAMGEIVWNSSSEYILIAIPLFVMLGEILLRAGIAERVYNAIAQWLSWLPGGLMHANIGACAMFAATSGSSVATAATIGTVALPEIQKRKYDEPLFLGTIAAGGTLGILIPPSINFILYGLLTNSSVPRLYLAGFIPGFALAFFFMVIVFAACTLDRRKGGIPIETNWADRFRVLPSLIPPLFIFLVVVGSIYAGIATPTEAASLGVIAALVLATWERRVSLPMLRAVAEGTMRTTAMIMAILLAAYFLNFVITSIGLTGQVNSFITSLGLTPLQLLIVVVLFYLILGMFMETLSMMVATVPIIAPIMFKAGYDPVWFGIIIIILMELAMITPPVGINLYVVQGLRKRGKIDDVIIGASPFVITMMLMIVILSAWPQIALWLPQLAAN
jgi:C4-dicarboxylate transporter DctM subunit